MTKQDIEDYQANLIFTRLAKLLNDLMYFESADRATLAEMFKYFAIS